MQISSKKPETDNILLESFFPIKNTPRLRTEYFFLNNFACASKGEHRMLLFGNPIAGLRPQFTAIILKI
jgi:hypothetical protein